MTAAIGDIRQALARAWSARSSSRWTAECPACGQCAPTSLVVLDLAGGSLRKTRVGGSWHFYNWIDGARCDFTADRFDERPSYQDEEATRAEAREQCTEAQYADLRISFEVEYVRGNGAAPLPIVYRPISSSDDLTLITHLLHRAYEPLAAAGMRFLASHQDVATTTSRMAGGETFVAALGRVVVGTITLRESSTTDDTPFYRRPDVAKFGQYAVWPSLQGSGIGARLLALVEERARAKGLSELALDTSEHATALIAMYTRHGFRHVGTTQWDDVNYRSVILSKTLLERLVDPAAPEA